MPKSLFQAFERASEPARVPEQAFCLKNALFVGGEAVEQGNGCVGACGTEQTLFFESTRTPANDKKSLSLARQQKMIKKC